MEMITNIHPHTRLTDRVVAPRSDLTQISRNSLPESIDSSEGFVPVWSDIHKLSEEHLDRNRIVAFRANHRVTRAFDMLRNQLAHQHADISKPIVAVTAPSPGCGTSVTAINLAFSFARLSTRPVLLVDANLTAPASERLLGLAPLPSRSRSAPGNQHIVVDASGAQINLLRPYAARSAPGTLASDEIAADIIRVRQALMPSVVILDLAALLHCDTAVQLLALADSTVLVVASNQTTRSEFEVSQTFFSQDKKVQVVLNKARRHGL